MMLKNIAVLICLLVPPIVYGQQKQILSVEQMHQDLSILKKAFSELHPGLYRYTTAAQLELNFKVLLKQTETPMDLRQFYIGLSQLTVKVHCGHTYVNPYNQSKALAKLLYSDQVLPFLFKIINRKIIITHNLCEDKDIRNGDEIASINGVTSKEIIHALSTVSKADGLRGKNKQIDNINLTPYLVNASRYALFDLYFPLLFPDKFVNNEFELIIKPFKGHSQTFNIPAVSKRQRQNQYQKLYPFDSQKYTGVFRWLNKKNGYLKISEFSNMGWKTDYKQFLDSIFTDLQRNNASNLVVDIRDNEGGDDEVRNEIITYLIKKPVVYPIRRYRSFLSINKSLLPYLITWDQTFKEPKDPMDYQETSSGLFYKKKIDADTLKPKVKHFSGQVYLITGATNSSSSFFMADILQYSKAAIVVGEATGGTKQGINGGQFFFLKLPSSGIEIDLPLIFQAPLLQRRDEGIQPEIKINTTQRDIVQGNDAVLHYLRKRF